MNFKKYQAQTQTTAVYPRPMDHVGLATQMLDEAQPAMEIVPIMYCALGLAGEAGEVAEQIKKGWRNDEKVDETRREKIKDELGDVLWYASQLATELGLSLEEIAQQNIEKLASRQKSSTLKEHS